MAEHIIMHCPEMERLYYNIYAALEAPSDLRQYITMWTSGFCKVCYKSAT